MLTLPIKKKWFDMILSGEKKEEYREIKPYYDSRFRNVVIVFNRPLSVHEETYLHLTNDYNKTDILFRNGYSKSSRSIKCMVSINIGHGNPDWGAIPDKEYYVLKILSVEEVK